ncbi:sensor histidine kinase [Streptomyces justiciae]|uniref:sensor histidine kinase n=1 Tax=Streptomyces justiciae TaxID=2780140 RepID=UPI002118D85E|nr:HAMP domain-containing sensor histidine kinase [Streptomyces justiciae]MCW8378667.1 HAMP domain-containing histidine kinase [Streptomyces justiciae]
MNRVRTVWERASLRSRVLLLAVALLAAGLSAFSLVAGNALRSYMEDRVDAQLRATAQVVALMPDNGASQKPPTGLGNFSTDILGNPVITNVDTDGTVESSIDSLAGTNRARDAQGPDLPRMDADEVAARNGRPFTVGSTKGDTRWRAIAVPRVSGTLLSGGSTSTSGSVIVSTSMAEVDSTVDRMWRIYESSGLALLALLAAIGWFAVRSGLRPLSRIEQTAAEIADGDLSRRVPELAGPKTELGRLTVALNGMFGQLETAFAARAESEARMGRFVADASHELRTPLAGIKGLTDLYRMGALADQEDIDATMSRIARESERLTRLVNDMLLLARLDERALKAMDGHAESGAPELDLAPTDLRTLAADALHDVRALDPTRAVTLTGPDGNGPPASAPALADEARLRQVVTNLVGNAITHTPSGTPIRIGVGTTGAYAVLEVADEGPGLPPEQSSRIFERFYRADTSRTRATGGSGLGLAIVQSLVTAHSGRVEVDSVPGQGAVFRVLLPRHADQHASTVPPESALRA